MNLVGYTGGPGGCQVSWYDKDSPGTGSDGAQRYAYVGSDFCESWDDAADLILKRTGRRPTRKGRTEPPRAVARSPLMEPLDVERIRVPARRKADNNDLGPRAPVERSSSVADNKHRRAGEHPLVRAVIEHIGDDPFDLKGYWGSRDELYAWVAKQKHLGLHETLLYVRVAEPTPGHLEIIDYADSLGLPVYVVFLPERL